MLLSLVLAAPIGEVEIYAPTPQLRAQAEGLGLVFGEGIDGPWVRYHGDAVALEAAQDQLTTRGYRPDHRLLHRQEGYHTPEQLNERLAELAADPRALLVQVGESSQGRPLLALRLGPEDAPGWRILGAHHGDELSSSELALAVAEMLVEGKGEWAGLLDSLQVWVMPAVNPDGMLLGTRFNANDVDLNRNYGFQWNSNSPYHGPYAFSEPETRSVRTLSLYAAFSGGLSLHSGAQSIGYPWNWTLENSPDEDRLRDLGDVYTEACGLSDFHTTNGADWYITHGDTNDWSLGRRGTWDYTVEVSEKKTPNAADLPQFIESHLPAVAELLGREWSLSGRVVSAETGLPVEALVEVRSSLPLWTGPDGHFARHLEVGVYEVDVSAPGYSSQHLEVGIPADEGVELQLELVPEGLLDWRLEPTLVSQATETVELRILDLSPLPKTLRLSRPGFDDVELQREGDSYPLHPASLEQGPWTVEVEQGVVPRALLVGAVDARVGITGAFMVGPRVLLHGHGFTPGTRAFALFGTERALVELPELGGDDSWLGFDATALPLDGTVDLVVLSNGREVGVADLLGTPSVDTAFEDTGDTGSFPAPPSLRLVPVGYRGCSTVPPAPALAWLLLLVARRRK